MLPRLGGVLFALCVGLTVLHSANAQTPAAWMTGAGTASAAEVMGEWSRVFWWETAGAVNLRYDAIGTAEGWQRLTTHFSNNPNNTFAVRDYPVPNAIKKDVEDDLGLRILHVPIALEAVSIAFNLPAGTVPDSARLRLDRRVVSRIYKGEIINWGDDDLVALNPFLEDVDLDIVPIGRLDQSGTSFAFTKWLSMSNDGMTPSDQPVFASAVSRFNYNSGVAQAIIEETGSLGYLTYGYAIAQGHGVALLENNDGNFVEPSFDSILASTTELGVVPPSGSDYWEGVSLVNVPGPSTYPICNILFAIVPADMSQMGFRAPATAALLSWAQTDQAQTIAQTFGYIPIPQKLRASNAISIASITLPPSLSSGLYWPAPPNAVRPAPVSAPADPTITFTEFQGFRASPPRDFTAADVTVNDFSVIFTIIFIVLFITLFLADNFYSGWVGCPNRYGWCEDRSPSENDSDKFEAELARLHREQDEREAEQRQQV